MKYFLKKTLTTTLSIPYRADILGDKIGKTCACLRKLISRRLNQFKTDIFLLFSVSFFTPRYHNFAILHLRSMHRVAEIAGNPKKPHPTV